MIELESIGHVSWQQMWALTHVYPPPSQHDHTHTQSSPFSLSLTRFTEIPGRGAGLLGAALCPAVQFRSMHDLWYCQHCLATNNITNFLFTVFFSSPSLSPGNTKYCDTILVLLDTFDSAPVIFSLICSVIKNSSWGPALVKMNKQWCMKTKRSTV